MAAKFNAESPLSFVAFTFAPSSMRIRVISSFPVVADHKSGVNPVKADVLIIPFFLNYFTKCLHEQFYLFSSNDYDINLATKIGIAHRSHFQ